MTHWDLDLIVRVRLEGIGYQIHGQASVNTVKGEAMKFCPNCGHDIEKYIAAESGHPSAPSVATLPTGGKYDAVATWKAILLTAEGRHASPPTVDSLVFEALENIKPGAKKTIVHIAFDREIVPAGGVLHRAAMVEGRTEMDADRLKKLGYAMDGDGHLITVDEIPVGNIYPILQYWGGAQQHKRWHMKYPIEVNPGRNGDTYFMDNNIAAFGVDWKDTSKMDEAFKDLLHKLGGFKGEIAGIPLVLELVTQ
jgi:hypothetical protein